MLSLITPDNLPGVLTAIGALVGGGGLITLRKVWKEPVPKPGTPDAAAVALVENTKALHSMIEKLAEQNEQMDEQTGQFGDNNKLFGQILQLVAGMAHDFAEARREMTLAREHLGVLRDQGNRRR